MGEISKQVKMARERIASATLEIVGHGVEIHRLQRLCKHRWRFHNQVNACHERWWNVTIQCRECERLITAKQEPICEKCLCTLVRAERNDRQANSEAKTKGSSDLGNPPLAFRCPKCKKIHILWHEGD